MADTAVQLVAGGMNGAATAAQSDCLLMREVAYDVQEKVRVQKGLPGTAFHWFTVGTTD